MANKSTAKPATKTAPKAEPKPEETFTKSDVEKMIAEAVKNALQNVPAASSQIVVNREEMVTFVYIGISAQGAPCVFGSLGKFTRAGTPLEISKKDFFKGVGDMAVSKLLETRVIVCVDGLTDEERERYDLNYADGEVLSVSEFYNIVNYDADKLAARYQKLCPEHKRVVMRLFGQDIFENGGRKTTIEKIKELRKINALDAQNLVPLTDEILARLGKKAVAE